MNYDDFDDDEVTVAEDDWKEQYRKLKINFDRLDKHNDLLYRVYQAAKLYVKATDNPSHFQFMREDLVARLREVEGYEKGLKNG